MPLLQFLWLCKWAVIFSRTEATCWHLFCFQAISSDTIFAAGPASYILKHQEVLVPHCLAFYSKKKREGWRECCLLDQISTLLGCVHPPYSAQRKVGTCSEPGGALRHRPVLTTQSCAYSCSSLLCVSLLHLSAAGEQLMDFNKCVITGTIYWNVKQKLLKLWVWGHQELSERVQPGR